MKVIKNFWLLTKKFLKGFWQFIDDRANTLCLLKKPFYLRWLFSGSYAQSFIKITVLFSIIWITGYFFSKSEKALIIPDGTTTAQYYNRSEIRDSFYVADNKINLIIKSQSDSISLYFKLVNQNVTKSIFIYDRIITLKKINSFEKEWVIDTIALGRHFNLALRHKNQDLSFTFKANGFGYLEDYPSYLLYLALILSLFLFKLLTEKFLYAFTGNNAIGDASKIDFNYNEGLLRTLKLNDKNLYQQKIRSVLENISAEKNQFGFFFFITIIFIISVILSIRIFVYQAPPEGNWNFSPNIFNSTYYYNQCKDILIYGVIIGPLLYKLIGIFIATVSLSYNFDRDESYDIKVLSFDNAGGLSPLGEITLIQFYIFIIFFPHVYAAAYMLNFPAHFQILLPLYLIFTFCLFFMPLSSPHRSMKEAKSKALRIISDHYNSLNKQYESISEITKDANFPMISKKMKKVKFLYDERKRMPVWPYDIEIFLKFGAVFLSNILLYLSEFIFSLFKH